MEPAASPLPAPLAYLNGEFMSVRDARLPVWDLGIVQAVTVTETLRTFSHQPFRLDDHLARLQDSLRAIDLQPRESTDQLRHLVVELTRFHSRQTSGPADFVINLFVTAGESQLHSGGLAVHPGRPTVCITVRPLEFRSAARQYRNGVALAIPSVRHIPASIIDPQIKYRSRLHWHLADHEVHRTDPAAEALLLDLDGWVTETARGNIFARFGEQLVTPSESTTLAGVSQQVVMDLCRARQQRVERRNLTPNDLARADEIVLSSTSICAAPVTRLNGRPVANGQPGPWWSELIGDWSRLVGLDIVAQANSLSADP